MTAPALDMRQLPGIRDPSAAASAIRDRVMVHVCGKPLAKFSEEIGDLVELAARMALHDGRAIGRQEMIDAPSQSSSLETPPC